MNASKIAIIGGAGFVGSRLGNRFKKKNMSYKQYDKNHGSEIDTCNYLDVEGFGLHDQHRNVLK